MLHFKIEWESCRFKKQTSQYSWGFNRIERSCTGTYQTMVVADWWVQEKTRHQHRKIQTSVVKANSRKNNKKLPQQRRGKENPIFLQESLNMDLIDNKRKLYETQILLRNVCSNYQLRKYILHWTPIEGHGAQRCQNLRLYQIDWVFGWFPPW